MNNSVLLVSGGYLGAQLEHGSDRCQPSASIQAIYGADLLAVAVHDESGGHACALLGARLDP